MSPAKKLDSIIKRFNLSKNDANEFISIVTNIYFHDEFQKRMSDEFLHHGDITLGEHILEDALFTYKSTKKKMKRNNLLDLELAVKIAMMHDLYEEPWQNRHHKVSNFFHLHGFRHPIEASINAAYWFKDEFRDIERARKIIDGIVHHMYPLPVNRVKNFDTNYLELRNFEKLGYIDDYIKDLIIESSNKHKIGGISFIRSKYKEGRIMSNSDKRSAISNLSSLSDATALITGKNKRLKK